MLDSKDVQLLENILHQALDSRLTESENKTQNLLESRLSDSETKMHDLLDSKLSDSENMLLNEMDRTRRILEEQISAIQNNLSKMQQHYQIAKLENDNTSMLLQIIRNLQKEIDDLKSEIKILKSKIA